MVNPQVTNLAIIVVMMQLAKKVPFDNPDVLLLVRGIYILSNVIILGLYLYTQAKINKRNDLTTLKYVEPAPLGSGEEARPVTTTNMEYDKGQLRQLIKSQLMGVGMMGVMHLYFKYTNPLLIQSIIPLKGAFEANLVKIHVFGKPATGDLQRPFKAANSFFNQGQVKTDKASLESAEKNWRGGVKEEYDVMGRRKSSLDCISGWFCWALPGSFKLKEHIAPHVNTQLIMDDYCMNKIFDLEMACPLMNVKCKKF
ncbi:Inorganic phosphate transport protein [Aspergillus ochraceoroseus]|uniref:Inorganic phosphate transport protein n=2 Tax=Aspergillus ochraceoroseus TaxID=138278 RepID=A0A0F8UYU6_9EURO|nr:Inorganic phosphate transport protein [Aspergillus ochraceoroseus]